MEIDFIERCNLEVENNNYKGDWCSWKPSIAELTKEINWHVAKLNHALLQEEYNLIQELSADVGNLCEKAHSLSTKALNFTYENDGYVDFLSYKSEDDKWSLKNE